MKVAILTRSFPPLEGGISSAQYGLAKLLAKRHEIRIFAYDDCRKSERPTLNRSLCNRVLAKISTWIARFYLRRFESNAEPDACSKILATIWSVRGLGIYIRRFAPDVILVPDNYLPGLSVSLPSGALKVWCAHHNYLRFSENPLLDKRSWMDLFLAHRLERRAIRRFDALVAPSAYMKSFAESTIAAKVPTHVIPNYVDMSLLRSIRPSGLRGKLGLDENAIIVYMPSVGSEYKGRRYAFELIRRLQCSPSLGIYVSGEVDETLKYEIDTLEGREFIYCPGRLSLEENLENVADCDFAVYPTLIDNLSMAIVEGLSLGVPFVTFDVGGNRELVRDGENGFVVPYLDIELLIEQSRRLVSDSVLRRRMSDRARSYAKDSFDPEKLLMQYEILFSASFRPER